MSRIRIGLRGRLGPERQTGGQFGTGSAHSVADMRNKRSFFRNKNRLHLPVKPAAPESNFDPKICQNCAWVAKIDIAIKIGIM